MELSYLAPPLLGGFRLNLEPYDCVGAAFDVDGVDEADALGIRCHHHRVRSFAGAEEPHTAKQRPSVTPVAAKIVFLARSLVS